MTCEKKGSLRSFALILRAPKSGPIYCRMLADGISPPHTAVTKPSQPVPVLTLKNRRRIRLSLRQCWPLKFEDVCFIDCGIGCRQSFVYRSHPRRFPGGSQAASSSSNTRSCPAEACASPESLCRRAGRFYLEDKERR